MVEQNENPVTPCLLCGEEIISDSVLVTKGIATLIQCSKLLQENLGKLLSNVEKITVHGACRKKYTDKRKITAALKLRESRRSSLRTSLSAPFDYMSDCVVCGTPCPSLEQRLKHPDRNPVSHVDPPAAT